MGKITFDKTFFAPGPTLKCGQIFRFSPFREGFFVVSGDKAAYVHEDGPDTVIECDDENYFYEFFDLGSDYGKIHENILAFGIPAVTKAADQSRGIRILRQLKEESIFSFIISQNNNIPRIKKIIEGICAALGEKKSFMGKDYFSFPSATVIAKEDTEFFRTIGAGYRDAYITGTADKIAAEGLDALDALPTPLLKNQLLTYPGVGPKVADCIALFGFHRLDSFPVDTWIEKVYHEEFGGTLKKREKICAYFTDTFGDLSGIVQQYLFFAKRES
ncbi:MAG: hypothetical protein LUD29_01740 [Clostridia bacterium]|nr:hypothetical protein [Clostridia bacterium]